MIAGTTIQDLVMIAANNVKSPGQRYAIFDLRGNLHMVQFLQRQVHYGHG